MTIGGMIFSTSRKFKGTLCVTATVVLAPSAPVAVARFVCAMNGPVCVNVNRLYSDIVLRHPDTVCTVFEVLLIVTFLSFRLVTDAPDFAMFLRRCAMLAFVVTMECGNRVYKRTYVTGVTRVTRVTPTRQLATTIFCVYKDGPFSVVHIKRTTQTSSELLSRQHGEQSEGTIQDIDEVGRGQPRGARRQAMGQRLHAQAVGTHDRGQHQ